MASRYTAIWEEIKKNGSKETVVRTKPGRMQALIRMVKKVKSKEVSIATALETASFGRLKIETFPNGTIKFRLVPTIRSFEL